jgi:hypothetical protein
MDRREFIKNLTALGVAAGVARIPGPLPHAWAVQEKGQMPYRVLGSTGEKVSIVGLGGFHLGRPEEQESIRIIRTAIDNGINFMVPGGIPAKSSPSRNSTEEKFMRISAALDDYKRLFFSLILIPI